MNYMHTNDDDEILLPTGVDYGKPMHPDDVEDILYPPGVGPAQEDRKGRDLPPLMDS